MRPGDVYCYRGDAKYAFVVLRADAAGRFSYVWLNPDLPRRTLESRGPLPAFYELISGTR